MANTTHTIQCVNRSDEEGHQAAIISVGGLNKDGTRWKIRQWKAIEGIEEGRWRFLVTANGSTREVIVATNEEGAKYLTTKNDGGQANALLSLPECPW